MLTEIKLTERSDTLKYSICNLQSSILRLSMDAVIQSQHAFKTPRWRQVIIPLAVAILSLTLGCGSGAKMSQHNSQKPLAKPLPSMGHTIQAGAFAKQDNAVRFTEKLQAQGLNAYHFRNQSGLYKVRIGNYRTIDTARRKAEGLKTAGIIDEYYLIGPGAYATVAPGSKDKAYLRKEIVRTANRFIGVRYRWGGQSSKTGFDCSGLTMVVYRLNGLELPRSSRHQWKSGRPVDPGKLSAGDLVFFATNGDGRVSHVGIYIGHNNFLHAPGSGRKIRISSMSNKYYKSRYLGARSYL
jgi:cell wall-associated NlpC family hydrolase